LNRDSASSRNTGVSASIQDRVSLSLSRILAISRNSILRAFSLQLEGRIRDLAMFNLAIDSKLRGCDVVALRVEDIAPNGYTNDRATIRQRKTGQSVKFELTEQTRQTVDDYLAAAAKKPGDFLFAGRRSSKCMIRSRGTMLVRFRAD
jgi:integrase